MSSMSDKKETVDQSIDTEQLKSLTDNIFPEQQTKENKVLQEMLLDKPIETTNNSTSNAVEDRLYKDFGTNKSSAYGQADQSHMIRQKIIMYRELSRNPELKDVITDIVNESIISDGATDYGVRLDLNTKGRMFSKISEKVINKIYKKFEDVLDKLNFDIDGIDIFKRWYIDGRLYIRIVRNNNDNIVAYEVLDPLYLQLQQEDDRNVYFLYDVNANKLPLDESNNNYGTIGNQFSSTQRASEEDMLKIEIKDIVGIFSGEYDYLLNIYVSELEKVMKTLNQLNNLEDAMVLHQFTRAIPRRLFKVNTGNLSLKDAEEYLNKIQKRHRESLNLKYDIASGKFEGEDRVRFLSTFDDYWLRADDKTTIENIDPVGNAEWDTITEKLGYFRKKLYRALNVPYTRFSAQENGGEEYKLAEGTIDMTERKFQKYIASQRKRFSELFYVLLEKEIISDNILNKAEYQLFERKIQVKWEDDNYSNVLRKFEIEKRKIEMLSALEGYVGKYYSIDYIQKEILERSDEEIDIIQKQIENDKTKYPEIFADEETGGEGRSFEGGFETQEDFDLGDVSFDGGGGEVPEEEIPEELSEPTVEPETPEE
jgi:hypothetical protein